MSETYVPSSKIVEMMKKQQGGKDQVSFAAEVGISPQSLSSIYLGTRRPGPVVLEYLSKRLGCRVEKAEGIFVVVTKGKPK